MLPLSALLLPLIPVLVYPALVFMYFRRLRTKRAQLKGLGGSPTLRDVFSWAYGGETPEKVLARHYDPVQYILPLLLCAGTTYIIVLMFLVTRDTAVTFPGPLGSLLRPTPETAFAGFLGAFLFGIVDMLRRVSVLDLSSTALLMLWVRLVCGVTIPTILTAAFAPGLQESIALAIGAFPISQLRDYLQKLGAKHLGDSAKLPSEVPTLQVLQGLTAEVIERFEEDGITSTQHLAMANPLVLFLRSNRPIQELVDQIDQAILHLYVGDRLDACRAVCLRSSIAIAEIHEYLDSGDRAELEKGKALLTALASALGTDRDAAENLVETLYYDPQVSFIWELWGKSFGGPEMPEPVVVPAILPGS